MRSSPEALRSGPFGPLRNVGKLAEDSAQASMAR